MAARNPHEVLRRIVDHDSIHLQSAVAPWLLEQCLLLDAERVFVRTATRIAYRASLGSEPGAAARAAWYYERLDEAVGDCLRQDEARLARSEFSREIFEEHAQFHWTFFVPEEAVLRAAVRFNGLPRLTRKSFFALLIERRSVDECVRAGLGPPERLRSRVLAALNAATGSDDEGETGLRRAVREG
ncbi:MAG: hypothetical protein AAFZ65_04805 [Planctomycetota bacterium]